MKHKRLIAIAVVFLVLLSPVLFRKYHVPLVSNGKTVAVGTRPFVFPILGNGECNVYAGNTKLFSLWADSFDSPIFIYPFADGKRFLCDYNDDTAILVFVVDSDSSTTNVSNFANWPHGYASPALIFGMTNVVIGVHGGLVRLPNYAELLEVSAYLNGLTSSQLKSRSFPWFDLGIYRTYASKEFLLADLATNRSSVWP